MGFFTDIYNTVAKFFSSHEVQEGDASKSVATNRLKLVLMQDRTNLTPKILEQMRSELIDLLSKYLEMDRDSLELNFEQEGDQVALMLSIPVIRAKDEEEIEAAIKESNTESSDISEEDDEENDENLDKNIDTEEETEDVEDSVEGNDSEECSEEQDSEKKVKRTKKKAISDEENANDNEQSEDTSTEEDVAEVN